MLGASRCCLLGSATLSIGAQAFHSIRAAWDYTVVRQLSSRGYQGTLWYPLHVTSWINPAIVVLAVVGTKPQRVLALWAWIPLCGPERASAQRGSLFDSDHAVRLRARGCRILTNRDVRQGQRLAGYTQRLAVIAVTAVVTGSLFRTRDNGDSRDQMRKSLLRMRSNCVRHVGWPSNRHGGSAGHLYFPTSDIVELDPDALTEVGYVMQRVRHHEWIMLDTARTRDPGLIASGWLYRARDFAQSVGVPPLDFHEQWPPPLAPCRL